MHLALQAAGGKYADHPFALPLRLTKDARALPAHRPTVTAFFDFSSPWSYLGMMQLPHLAARTGAVIKPVPCLVGALFRTVGTPMLPAMAMPAVKREHMSVDLFRCAKFAGVPLKWSVRGGVCDGA